MNLFDPIFGTYLNDLCIGMLIGAIIRLSVDWRLYL